VHTISSQLLSISKGLKAASEASEVVIQCDKNEFRVDVISSIIAEETIQTLIRTALLVKIYCEHKIKDFLGVGVVGQSSANQNSTLAYFMRIFGEKRIKRFGFGNAPIPLVTKKDVEKIFVHSCEVQAEDIQDLLDELNSDKSEIRYLNMDDITSLRENLTNCRNIADCTNVQLDLLFKVLVPFVDVSHLLDNRDVADVESFALDSGKTMRGTRERAFLYEKIRRDEVSSTAWIMYLSKRLADREMIKGTVFRS